MEESGAPHQHETAANGAGHGEFHIIFRGRSEKKKFEVERVSVRKKMKKKRRNEDVKKK